MVKGVLLYLVIAAIFCVVLIGEGEDWRKAVCFSLVWPLSLIVALGILVDTLK